MKIVHLCVNSFYTDGYSYQDNLLPKYHKKLGHEVTIITSKLCFSGNKIIVDNRNKYVNDDGVNIIRLASKYDENYDRESIKSKFNVFYGLIDSLNEEKPDILFIHGLNFVDLKRVVKYLKSNRAVKVYVDNHSDYSNSATNILSKFFLHRIIWKHYAKKIIPYTDKFYGVLPARVDFLIDNYCIPKEKCELLLMGADDDLIDKCCNDKIVKTLKKEYHIDSTDFVIVTGGKIDKAKMQTLLLMQAVKNISNKKIKLIIFGSVEENIKQEFNKLCDDNIKYIGWISNDQAYQVFNMADLVVFPGRHSVYWEIVVAIGKPILCKNWDGTNHIDIGGNVEYLYNDSVKEIEEKLREIIYNDKKFKKMVKNANKIAKRQFLYSEIAKKSIN